MTPSKPTEVLLDVNLIIAAVFADHVMHSVARNFVIQASHFYTTPMTQGGFLRFATRPWKNANREEQPPRLSMAAAQSKLREFVEVEGHIFLPDDISFLEVGLRSMQGHRQWTDAYLLALARDHNLVMASLEDRLVNLDDPKQPVHFLVS